MKTKYAALVITVALALASMSYADEQRPAEGHTQTMKIKRLDGTIVELTQDIQTQTVKIKAHGETVAEFKVSTNNPVVLEGGIPSPDLKRFIGVKGNAVTIRINCSGEFPFIFKADEVEFDDRSKSFLLAE